MISEYNKRRFVDETEFSKTLKAQKILLKGLDIENELAEIKSNLRVLSNAIELLNAEENLLDDSVVKIADAQTITGLKTFSNLVVFTNTISASGNINSSAQNTFTGTTRLNGPILSNNTITSSGINTWSGQNTFSNVFNEYSGIGSELVIKDRIRLTYLAEKDDFFYNSAITNSNGQYRRPSLGDYSYKGDFYVNYMDLWGKNDLNGENIPSSSMVDGIFVYTINAFHPHVYPLNSLVILKGASKYKVNVTQNLCALREEAGIRIKLVDLSIQLFFAKETINGLKHFGNTFEISLVNGVMVENRESSRFSFNITFYVDNTDASAVTFDTIVPVIRYRGDVIGDNANEVVFNTIIEVTRIFNY